MIDFVVRGPNWKIDIKLNIDFGDETFSYVEAATQAIEQIYSDYPPETLDGTTCKFTPVIQVSKKEHDIKIPLPKSEQTEENIQHANSLIEDKLIKFVFTPYVLANAGRFSQAEFLKEIIENES